MAVVLDSESNEFSDELAAVVEATPQPKAEGREAEGPNATSPVGVLTKVYKDLERTRSALEAQGRQYRDAIVETGEAVAEVVEQQRVVQLAIEKLSE